MAYVLKSINNWTLGIMELRDRRAHDVSLTSPASLVFIIAGYLYFIRIGTRMMRNRKPFQLRGLIMTYNIVQVVLNFWLFSDSVYKLARHSRPYRWQCEPVTSDLSYYGRIEFSKVYDYYLLKILDFADTVFFVLRKKDSQLSFLHVYHHVAVLWGTFITVNWFPGGHFAFLGLLNSFVHGIMYSYYFATLYRPTIRDSLTVKKIVTLIQLVQFGTLIFHSASPILFGFPCFTHKFLLFLSVIQNTFLMCMFIDFYYKAYILVPRKQLQKNNNIISDNQNRTQTART